MRRWDGVAEVNLTNSTISANSALGARKMAAAAGKAKLTVDAFSMQLAFDGKELLTGDYWLIELRRFAPEAERIRLVGTADNQNAMPMGVQHHFCALFEVEDGMGVAPDDATRRRLSFPPLTDIPATHVAFTPNCPPFFDNAENVADALNALCDLDASQVAFDPPADCARFEGTETVDEALKKLCSVQDDTVLTQVLRVMMDWGVVCGIYPHLVKVGGTVIAWSAGTMLDRTDPTMEQAFKACVEGRKKIDFGEVVRPLNPQEITIVKRLADVWANRKVLDGQVSLTRKEAKVTEAVNKTLMAEYIALAEPDRQERVEKLIAPATEEYNPGAVNGAARDVRRMQLETAKFGIIAAAEDEDRKSCFCSSGLVPCPPDAGKFGHLVPVGCVKPINFRSEVSPLASLCVYCCRKQAMIWRSSRYYQGSFVPQIFDNPPKKECCNVRGEPDEDFGNWLDQWAERLHQPPNHQLNLLPPPTPHPIWPPKLHLDYGFSLGYPNPIINHKPLRCAGR